MLKKEDKASLIALIVVVGFVVSVFFHYFQAYYNNEPFPKNTFLYSPAKAWGDFYEIFEPIKAGTIKFTVYFPFAYIPFFLLSVFPVRMAANTFVSAFIIAAVWFVYAHLDFLPRVQRWTVTIILSLFTYPLLFCIDRANLEGIVFLLLALFFISFKRENTKLSVLFLSCAAAMKFYPGIFVILYLVRRQYRPMFAVGITTGLLSLLCASFYPGGAVTTFKNMSANMNEFKQAFIVGNSGMPFSCSYFGLIKVLMRIYNNTVVTLADNYQNVSLLTPKISSLTLPYTITCLVLFSLICLYLLFRERTLWKQVALLTFAMLLFPVVSFDYKLIHLLFPLMFFITADECENDDRSYALIFGLLLIPKAYYWFMGSVSISVILNPLLMTMMALTIMGNGLKIGRTTEAKTESGLSQN